MDLSWSVISSPSVYRFHVTSWSVADKQGVLAPCSSPAGLFSFEADINAGILLSVAPGPLDHGSLISFLHKTQPKYPHKTQSQLLELAKLNAFEEAFATATILWSSLGRAWPNLGATAIENGVNNEVGWKSEASLDADFAYSLSKVSKRLYRDVEAANRIEVRDRLLDLENPAAKRAKLMSSKKTTEKQELESNTETLYRALLMRSVNLPYSLASSSTPFKPKNKKKKNKEAELARTAGDDVDSGSGGFVRTAQLWSQLTPDALQVNNTKHLFNMKASLVPGTTDPKSVEITSTLTANLAFAGITCPVAHLSYSNVWFMWNKSYDRDAVTKNLELARTWLKYNVPSVAGLFESRTGVRRGTTDYELDASRSSSALRSLSDALWLTWSTDNGARHLSIEDFTAMVNFITKKNTTTEQEALVLMRKIQDDANATTLMQKTAAFDSWAQQDSALMYFDLRFECSRFMSKLKKGEKAGTTPQDYTKNWEPCLLVVDLSSSTASVYAGKAITKAQGNTASLGSSDLKKSLLSSFSWKTHIVTHTGPVENSLCFGRTQDDPMHVIKFNAADLALIQRAASALSTINGRSEASQSNQIQHSMQMLDLAIPALVGLGQPLASSEVVNASDEKN